MYLNNLIKCNSHSVAAALKYSKVVGPNLKLQTMPKIPKHIPEAQKQRRLIKEKFSRYVPGRITLQVLGTGAKGAPRSLYVFSDQSRYLFNCGEGTQRLAHEHKMKLSKLEHIFVTQSTWSNIGGLPGTALTIQDVGVPQITLHGPDGLDEIFLATRRFVILRDLKVELANCDRANVFEDNVMQVRYVPIKKSKTESTSESETVFQRTASLDSTNGNRKMGRRSRSCSPNKMRDDIDDCIDYYAHEQSRRKIENSEGHASRLLSLRDSKEQGNVMCYVCKLQPRPGALSLDKCVKVGVPSGPLLGKLKNGEDIVLASGVTVRSKDVCEPDDPGPVFLVVDCPTEEYLEGFLQEKEFEKYQHTSTDDNLVAYLVVHFTPSNIINHPKYREWISKFSPSTQHLVLNETNTCMGSESVHRVQYKLNLLHDAVFPLLSDRGSKYDLNRCQPEISKRLKTDENGKLECNCTEIQTNNTVTSQDVLIQANTFCNFHLRPKKGLDRSSELLLKPAEYIDETMAEVDFANVLNNLKTQIGAVKDTKARAYPNFVFLGTGSCIPNKTRNTSGILFRTNSGNILLDCGEGTFGQLVRFFGPDKSDEVLANIKAIFVSHLHADHHIGLIGVLQGRRRALNRLQKFSTPAVHLLAPKQILTWLNFYDRYFEDISQEFNLISNDCLLHNEHTLFEGTDVHLRTSLGMSDISTAYVRHCPNAFGVAFTSRTGYKICYSGDTMPSENLINLGMRCDLLIHEATMEDELEKEAVIKMHSTTSQAIEVGRNMNAKYILLTHFSQRYAKLPRFNENFSDNVGIAFDNMAIRLDELPLLHLFYPALRLMFAEHYEELETKSFKRQMRQEREESLDRALSSAKLQNQKSTDSVSPTNDVNANTSEVLMEVDPNQR
ncbi:hypothetical protein PPYR_13636 [Photinus pyralis]|uniref:Zinc phosphodiesterase ELAC protein 2 n=1 Tax=Photinus pyralis TaxID=7054 RepID=A0A1Y1LMC1_PHOPY|nr:ribonuclease Z, mitochondrial isoform X2 [Photinus pyralis]KAB0794016.1 hypothetical protein PPYR_13636 [Photinus pyralis]